MAVQRLGQDTTSVNLLTWDGRSFGDTTADCFWARLPSPLKEIALAELASSNTPYNILFNETRGIVLLAFDQPPMTPRPITKAIRVHTSFDNGNYCYDGTLCTYEDTVSGCFLAFNEPE